MNSPFFAFSENSTSNVNVYTFVISLYRYLRYASKFTFDINAFNKLYSKKDNFFSFLVTTVQGGGGHFLCHPDFLPERFGFCPFVRVYEKENIVVGW